MQLQQIFFYIAKISKLVLDLNTVLITKFTLSKGNVNNKDNNGPVSNIYACSKNYLKIDLNDNKIHWNTRQVRTGFKIAVKHKLLTHNKTRLHTTYKKAIVNIIALL